MERTIINKVRNIVTIGHLLPSMEPPPWLPYSPLNKYYFLKKLLILIIIMKEKKNVTRKGLNFVKNVKQRLLFIENAK